MSKQHVSNPEQLIPVYGSETSDYAGDFAEFLKTTDQKKVARAWFDDVFLPNVDPAYCIDFGCGDGAMVPVLQPHFDKLIGIDFNVELVEKAHQQYKEVPFVLCDLRNIPRGMFQGSCGVESHVKFYLDGDRDKVWEELTDAEVSCLSPGGKLLNVLQSGSATYQKMIGELVLAEAAFDLQPWAKAYAKRNGHEIDVQTTEAWVTSQSLEDAVRVGIFMLNLVPGSILKDHRPTRGELAEWLHDQVYDAGNDVWKASCRQDHIVLTLAE